MSSETKELGGPRLGRVALLFFLCLGIPLALLNGWTLDQIQVRVVNANTPEKDPPKPWVADTQRWIAHAYSYTLRHDAAADRYQWAHDLYARAGDFNSSGNMLFRHAQELEAAGKKWAAKPVYEAIEKDYKDYPIASNAHNALVRINSMSRP